MFYSFVFFFLVPTQKPLVDCPEEFREKLNRLGGNQVSHLDNVPHDITFDVVDVLKTQKEGHTYYRIANKDGLDYYIWSPSSHQAELENDFEGFGNGLKKYGEVTIRWCIGKKKKFSYGDYQPSKSILRDSHLSYLSIYLFIFESW